MPLNPGHAEMPHAKRPRKQKTAAASASRRSPQLPDRRAMESVLAALSPAQRAAAVRDAQAVMYQAWETPRRQDRLALARRALEISPLCADAYVLLAEDSTKDPEQARDLYARGVEAGALALGPEAFVSDVGSFWGLLETRPDMRARCGLAQTLWLLGARDEAIAHYQDMLRLNPNDNQGIRYLLVAGRLEIDDLEALQQLLNAYERDGSPVWTYTRALLAYRRSGATPDAAALVAEALQSNAHVPAFLAGHKTPPSAAPESITLGGEDEAADYARDCGAAWRRTPGALDWLLQTVAALPPPPRRGAQTPPW